MILFTFYVIVSIGGALKQEGCEIIGHLLCNGVNRRGSPYAGTM